MDEIVRMMAKNVELLDQKLDEHMKAQTAIDNSVKPTESDVRLILNIIRKEWNLDALGNPKDQYDENDHPGRRVDDNEGKDVNWKKTFVDKIMSPVLVGITLWVFLEFVPDLMVLAKTYVP